MDRGLPPTREAWRRTVIADARCRQAVLRALGGLGARTFVAPQSRTRRTFPEGRLVAWGRAGPAARGACIAVPTTTRRLSGGASSAAARRGPRIFLRSSTLPKTLEVIRSAIKPP